jgi:hypothetical protein
MLTERLDQHRGRGQQQIALKHVSVKADQAVVADQVVSGRTKQASVAGFLTAGSDPVMEMIDPAEGCRPCRGGRVRGEMSDNPCIRLTLPRDAERHRSGLAHLVARLLCEAGRSAECRAPARVPHGQAERKLRRYPASPATILLPNYLVRGRSENYGGH